MRVAGDFDCGPAESVERGNQPANQRGLAHAFCAACDYDDGHANLVDIRKGVRTDFRLEPGVAAARVGRRLCELGQRSLFAEDLADGTRRRAIEHFARPVTLKRLAAEYARLAAEHHPRTYVSVIADAYLSGNDHAAAHGGRARDAGQGCNHHVLADIAV